METKPKQDLRIRDVDAETWASWERVKGAMKSFLPEEKPSSLKGFEKMVIFFDVVPVISQYRYIRDVLRHMGIEYTFAMFVRDFVSQVNMGAVSNNIIDLYHRKRLSLI